MSSGSRGCNHAGPVCVAPESVTEMAQPHAHLLVEVHPCTGPHRTRRARRDRVLVGPLERVGAESAIRVEGDRKSTRLNSSHSQISYAVFCLKKKIDTVHSV